MRDDQRAPIGTYGAGLERRDIVRGDAQRPARAGRAAGAFAAALVAAACSGPTPAPAGSGSAAAPSASSKPLGKAEQIAAAVKRVDGQTFPADLGAVPVPADNPQSDAKVALGHQLFFDPRLSADGSVSCYSCHQNEDGNGGHDPLAIGAKQVPVGFHSPVIWNVGFLPRFYWNGRADSLEAQGTAAWAGANMGVGKDNLEAKAKELAAIPAYRAAFDAVFPGAGVTPTTVVQALAAYERTLVCGDTAYDRYARGDKAALSDEQKWGLDLFLGAAGCAACHAPPHFSVAYAAPEGAYFDVGIAHRAAGGDAAKADPGRMKVTGKPEDRSAFKVPTLRNVAKSAPYFHDGSTATLRDAVVYMASGGTPHEGQTPLLSDRKLTAEQIDAVVAFLGALSCEKGLDRPTLPADK